MSRFDEFNQKSNIQDDEIIFLKDQTKFYVYFLCNEIYFNVKIALKLFYEAIQIICIKINALKIVYKCQNTIRPKP